MILRIKLRNFIPPEKAINCSNYVHNFLCDQKWSHINCTYNFIKIVFGELRQLVKHHAYYLLD